ncbi:MAG: hypothetical protein B7Z02_06840 [Rhodobacterales bacterium 32-67-9]|nr:MAG: hypothetical protein B7Z02_06840 [Rhodobacterales bacterium 32-67-9]
MDASQIPETLADLTRFIETRYHATHRAQLPLLADRSELVETIHAGQPDVPVGLAALLRRMLGELEVHMKKEELILFPAIRNAAVGLDPPIAAMRADHDDHNADIEKIHGLTRDLTLPDGACRSWTQLYADLGVFLDDLREHIRLENDILFPPFETGDPHHV